MSQLDQIIPPEVSNDEFYSSLKNLASNPKIKTILEIGSSSGGGSTQAMVEGILERDNLTDIKLYCMELSRPRYIKLTEAYEKYNFVKSYNLSSIPLVDFPSNEEVELFYKSIKTNLNNYPLETILNWLKQDIDYIIKNSVNYDGISFIKQANSINKFDFVLIDGSEFTGERELIKVIGANYIALDDVNAFKCFSAYKILSTHFGYKLIAQNLQLRNGFAIFEKIY